MKKYLIFAAAALLALAACSKVTPVEQPDQAISFQVVKYVNSTKADDDEPAPADYKTNYQNVPFGTFAFMNTDVWTADASGTANVYMNNVKVEYTNNTWAPNPTYYWPKSAKLTFASYSPYVASGYGVPTYDKAKGYQFTDYVITADANVDLMVADLAADKSANDDNTYQHGYQGVPTLFRHLLTDLQFKFKRAEYGNDNVDETKSYISVTKVELFNFIDTKSYGKTTAEAWDVNTAAASGKSLDITNGTLKLDKDVVLPETPKDVIIMPQTLVNPNPAQGDAPTVFQILRVTYDIVTYFTGQTNPVTESNVVSTVPFYFAGQAATNDTPAVPAITEFKKNQKIVYTVTIFPYANNPILFDPAVVDWDSSTTGTLTIDK